MKNKKFILDYLLPIFLAAILLVVVNFIYLANMRLRADLEDREMSRGENIEKICKENGFVKE